MLDLRIRAPQKFPELQKQRVQYLHYQNVPVDDIVRQTEVAREQTLAWCHEHDEDIANDRGYCANTLRSCSWELRAQGMGLTEIVRKIGARYGEAIRMWIAEFDKREKRGTASRAVRVPSAGMAGAGGAVQTGAVAAGVAAAGAAAPGAVATGVVAAGASTPRAVSAGAVAAGAVATGAVAAGAVAAEAVATGAVATGTVAAGKVVARAVAAGAVKLERRTRR